MNRGHISKSPKAQVALKVSHYVRFTVSEVYHCCTYIDIIIFQLHTRSSCTSQLTPISSLFLQLSPVLARSSPLSFEVPTLRYVFLWCPSVCPQVRAAEHESFRTETISMLHWKQLILNDITVWFRCITSWLTVKTVHLSVRYIT